MMRLAAGVDFILGRLRLAAALAVVGVIRSLDFLNHGAVHVGVVHVVAVHLYDGRVVLENIAFPMSAVEAGAVLPPSIEDGVIPPYDLGDYQNPLVVLVPYAASAPVAVA